MRLPRRAGRAGEAAAPLDAERGRRFIAVERRRHGHGLFRQGRSRHRAAHRDPADGGRRARHRARPHRRYRGRHRADARSGADRRQQRHHARRRADPPGGGDGARGADRARRRRGSAAARGYARSRPTARCAPKAGGEGIRFGDLVGDKRFDAQGRSEGAAQGSRSVHGRRQAAAAARRAGEGHWPPHLRARFRAADGMLHGRVVRPPAVGAKLLAVDEARSPRFPACAWCAIKDFLGVVAEDEWDAVCALRALKVTLVATARRCSAAARCATWMRAGPFDARRDARRQGRRATRRFRPTPKKLTAELLLADADRTARWARPARSPTCATARRDDLDGVAGDAPVPRDDRARSLGLPPKNVRLIYLDGAGCYGMNGHDDAAADAALLSQRGRPAGARAMDARGRARLGPEGAAAAARRSKARSTPDGRIVAWRTEMWLPQGDRAACRTMPLLAPARGRHCAAATGIAHGPHQPERRPALRGRRIRGAWCIG